MKSPKVLNHCYFSLALRRAEAAAAATVQRARATPIMRKYALLHALGTRLCQVPSYPAHGRHGAEFPKVG